MQEKELVTRKRMAEILKISTRKLDRMVSEGKIPSISLGRRSRRFDSEKVIEALKGEDDAH